MRFHLDILWKACRFAFIPTLTLLAFLLVGFLDAGALFTFITSNTF
jgi:hypothetical protein